MDGPSALFSNLFRYVGLQRGLGAWVDADVLMLRSIADIGDHIFGWEDDDHINGAILRLPADSPLLRRAIRNMRARVPIDPRWTWGAIVKQRALGCIGRQIPLGKLPWGVAGPAAITAYAKRYGIANLAQPLDVFYPIHWSKVASLLDPAADIEASITPQTRAVHLWNTGLRDRKDTPPPHGSYLARMCERHGITHTSQLPA